MNEAKRIDKHIEWLLANPAIQDAGFREVLIEDHSALDHALVNRLRDSEAAREKLAKACEHALTALQRRAWPSPNALAWSQCEEVLLAAIAEEARAAIDANAPQQLPAPAPVATGADHDAGD